MEKYYNIINGQIKLKDCIHPCNDKSNIKIIKDNNLFFNSFKKDINFNWIQKNGNNHFFDALIKNVNISLFVDHVDGGGRDKETSKKISKKIEIPFNKSFFIEKLFPQNKKNNIFLILNIYYALKEENNDISIDLEKFCYLVPSPKEIFSAKAYKENYLRANNTRKANSSNRWVSIQEIKNCISEDKVIKNENGTVWIIPRNKIADFIWETYIPEFFSSWINSFSDESKFSLLNENVLSNLILLLQEYFSSLDYIDRLKIEKCFHISHGGKGINLSTILKSILLISSPNSSKFTNKFNTSEIIFCGQEEPKNKWVNDSIRDCNKKESKYKNIFLFKGIKTDGGKTRYKFIGKVFYLNELPNDVNKNIPKFVFKKENYLFFHENNGLSITEDDYFKLQDLSIQKILLDPSKNKEEILLNARILSIKPAQQNVIKESVVKRIIRNPKIAAATILRAEGVCDLCGKHGPFKRNDSEFYFLESHHLIPLSEGGDDAVYNTVALCPNCHRKIHFFEKDKKNNNLILLRKIKTYINGDKQLEEYFTERVEKKLIL